MEGQARWRSLSKVSAEARREVVAKMYLMGYSQRHIAAEIDVTQPTVVKDLAEMREQWRSNAQEAFGERLALELAKIDRMEEVAWEEWERSRSDQVTKATRTDAVPKELEGDPDGTAQHAGKRRKRTYAAAPMIVLKTQTLEQKVGRCGNEAFLGRVAWCIETRCKLLGLLKPDKMQQNTIVTMDWRGLAVGNAGDGDVDPLEQQIDAVRTGSRALPPHPGINGTH